MIMINLLRFTGKMPAGGAVSIRTFNGGDEYGQDSLPAGGPDGNYYFSFTPGALYFRITKIYFIKAIYQE